MTVADGCDNDKKNCQISHKVMGKSVFHSHMYVAGMAFTHSRSLVYLLLIRKRVNEGLCEIQNFLHVVIKIVWNKRFDG